MNTDGWEAGCVETSLKIKALVFGMLACGRLFPPVMTWAGSR